MIRVLNLLRSQYARVMCGCNETKQNTRKVEINKEEKKKQAKTRPFYDAVCCVFFLDAIDASQTTSTHIKYTVYKQARIERIDPSRAGELTHTLEKQTPTTAIQVDISQSRAFPRNKKCAG